MLHAKPVTFVTKFATKLPGHRGNLARVQKQIGNSYSMSKRKTRRQRLADCSLFLPFVPVFAYIYAGLLIDYVRWHVRDSRESNNK